MTPEFIVPVVFAGMGLLFVVMVGIGIWARFKILEDQRRDSFPVPVPGWGARMASPVPFHATAEDLGAMFGDLVGRLAAVKGWDRDELISTVNACNWHWLPADNSLIKVDGNLIRHVKNPWYGRGSDVEYVAGWHQGRDIFVVYRPEDRIGHTACVHELAHALTTGFGDPDHSDTVIWEQIVPAVKREWQ